jgi:dimethylglycine oxidase
MDKGDFVGRGALEGRSETTAARRLVPLTIADRAAVVMGKEPVEVDGRPAGYVTSAAYGYSIDAPIAYAWLPSDAAHAGQDVTIRYFGEAVPATVATDPMFDPEMTRLRG